MNGLAVFALLVLPFGDEVEDRVDCIEVNAHYDSDGSLIFEQVIFWEWDDLRRELVVVDWRLLKEVREPVPHEVMDAAKRNGDPPPIGRWKGGHACPFYDNKIGRYVSHWYDEKSRCYRRVLADTVRRTWTQHDPELVERERFPVAKRRGLCSPQRY